MNRDEPEPDEESHHVIEINKKQVSLTFRYFSPAKMSSTESKFPKYIDQFSSKSDSIANEVIITKQETKDNKAKDLQMTSNKFFRSNMQQIQFSTLDSYEKFHNKLYSRITSIEQKPKTIKLRLTTKSKQKIISTIGVRKIHIKKIDLRVGGNKLFKQGRQPMIMKLSGKKRKSISQQKQKQNINQSRKQKSYRQIYGNLNTKPNIVIKLYEKSNFNSVNKLKFDQNSLINFQTPRRNSTSRRKGIQVFSSTSTRKNSSQPLVKPDNLHSLHNISTNIQEIEDKRFQNSSTKSNPAQRESRPVTDRIQQQRTRDVKSRALIIKQRVYSKSRLKRKSRPDCGSQCQKIQASVR